MLRNAFTWWLRSVFICFPLNYFNLADLYDPFHDFAGQMAGVFAGMVPFGIPFIRARGFNIFSWSR